MTGMSGVAVQAGVDPRVGRTQLVRVVLAVLLLGRWALWATSTYQSQLRIAPATTFHDDLASGTVVPFRVATNVRHDRVWPPDGSPDMVDLPATNEDGTFVRPDGVSYGPPPTVVYWTDASVGAVRVLDANDSRTPSAEALVQELREAGVPPAGPGNDWPGDSADVWGLLTGALALLAVVFGPVPTRGTRWFWFWVTGVTWGLGVVAYAVAELLRPRPEPHVDGSALEGDGPEDGSAASAELEGVPGQRTRGWMGLLLAVVLGIALSVLGSEISQAVGGVWVPLP
jgi:hypothetical protein